MYKPYFKIEESKKAYQQDLLNSSFEEKINALNRIKEKKTFMQGQLSESFMMLKVIEALDALIKENLIEDWVMGGATALLYYSTPHLTEDINIFISIKSKSSIVNLAPIYEYLKWHYAAKEDREYILLAHTPIQLLMPEDKLTDEAVKNTQVVSLSGQKFKIMKLEYLIAIMLNLGKSKYRERLRIVKEESKYDKKVLEKLLIKYNLLDKWNKFE